MKRQISQILKSLGYAISRIKPERRIPSFSDLWMEASDEARELMAPFLASSKSQYAQDLFVVKQTRAMTGGFFVEFGATDGVRLSNTWLLEKKLGWTGILAEPARVWHTQLNKNRDCSIDYRCVTDASGQFIEFLETGDATDQYGASSPELSSMAKYADSGDWASNIRLKNSVSYEVQTVSLTDLLNHYAAPPIIDYMSIDTEGSEMLILQAFDFSQRLIRVITVEHNHDVSNRQALYDLLTANGYIRVYMDISGADDWYVHQSAG